MDSSVRPPVSSSRAPARLLTYPIQGGRRTIPASFITSALITATLQYTTNAVRVTRVQTLLARQPATPPCTAASPTHDDPASSTSDGGGGETPASPSSSSWLDRVQSTLGKWSPVRKLSDEAYAEILGRQRAEVRAALEAWERSMGASGVHGKRPEIDVEQATRELDSLERKIRALEDKMRAGA